MKKEALYVIILVLIMVAFTSCEKEENDLDTSRYRIIKIADNMAMENPLYTFEYNSQGKVVKISCTYGYYEVEYNQNGNPVKISSFDLEGDKTSPSRIITIQWKGNSFITGSYKRKNIYHLDKNKHLKSIIILQQENDNPVYNITRVETFTKTSNNKIKHENYPIGFSENSLFDPGRYEETYTLGTLNSPFKGIHVAVLCLTNISFGMFMYEFQNEFNIVGLDGQGGFKATIDYDYNENNYPVRADIVYISFGEVHKYAYFEYETY